MRILVDTHVMLWWTSGDPRLALSAAARLRDGGTRLLWSLASSWEMAVKIGVGKLALERPLHRFFADLVRVEDVEPLAVTTEHCVRMAELPLHHRDPFDRMLVAQAQCEGVPILTADPKIAHYDVETIDAA